MDKKQIVKEIISASKIYNLPPKIVLAQAILETGYFKNAPYNNFFGIKASKKDIEFKRYYEVPTIEYINGQKVKIKAKFAKFNSIKEAVQRYNEIIKKNFPNADKNRNNDVLFLKGLFTGKYKYATDANYIKKINSILNKVNKILIENRSKIAVGSGILTLLVLSFFFKDKILNLVKRK